MASCVTYLGFGLLALRPQLSNCHPQIAGRYHQRSLRCRVGPHPRAAVLVPTSVREGAGELAGKGSLQSWCLALVDATHGDVLEEGVRAHAVARGRRGVADGSVHGPRGFLCSVPLPRQRLKNSAS